MDHFFCLVCVTLCSVFISVLGDYCPYKECDCYEDTIDCNQDGLTELPELMPVDMVQPFLLDLNNNQLTKIPAGKLPLGLYGIDFSENPISSIDDDAFRDIADNLTDLSFAHAMFTDLPRALLQLNKLQHFTIADTPIIRWDEDVVRHIGSTLQTLILLNVSLPAWPTWVSFLPHLGTLELSFMRIQVPDDAFDNQINTLFSVNFENCNLTEIPNALSKLKHLQYLVLDNNNITKVTGLPNSPNLTTLTLDGNQISDAAQLSEGLLPVANSLTSLELRENRLQSIPDLSAMVKLDSLDMTQNVIFSIGSGKVPPSLTIIDLENNYLPSLNFFMQISDSLMILRFDHNSVQGIRGVDIPVSVSDMSIVKNRITELTDSSFPENCRMGSLTLDYNPISKISIYAFVNLNSLVYMSMVGTQLTRLPLAFGALASLKTVSLDQSAHLVCTCVEKDLQEWALDVYITGDCGMTSVAYFFQFMSEQCPD